MEDYRKIAIELGQTLISKAPETREDVERMLPELKESEDERISKHLLYHFRNKTKKEWNGMPVKDILAWIEEQEQHKKFRDSIQVGDKVTKNEDGVLVNLSQLKRVAKNYKKQGEQNPAGKVEPKFKIGDWVVRNGKTLQISGIDTVLDGTFHYWFTKGTWLSSKKMENAMLWTIQDAKDGDVVVDKSDGTVGIFQSIGHHPDGGSYNDPSYCFLHCRYDDGFFYADFDDGNTIDSDDLIPATKEQHDTLMKAMADAGYTFDFEKKKLKKIEQPKQEWSEEDTEMIDCLIRHCKKEYEELCNDKYGHQEIVSDLKRSCRERWDWLESLKNKIVPQSHWKPTEEQLIALELACSYEDGNNLRELLEQLKAL